MKLSEEEKGFIKNLLKSTRPIFDRSMDHLRQTDPKEYARLHQMAVESGLYS